MSSQRDDPRTQDDSGQPTGGMPGDGAARREEPGHTGVYPFSSEEAPDDAPMRASGSWGRSDYDESGRSETSSGPGTEAGAEPTGDATLQGPDSGVDLSHIKATADVPGGAMTQGPADRQSGRNDTGGS